jgi:hypothetical protein
MTWAECLAVSGRVTIPHQVRLTPKPALLLWQPRVFARVHVKFRLLSASVEGAK